MARVIQLNLEVKDNGSAAVENATKKINRSFKDIEAQSKSTTEVVKKSWGNVALAVTAAATAIAASLAMVSKNAIMLASDMQETQGKFDVVFRGMTATAETWASKLQQSYAMSELEGKKYLSSLQNLIVPTGIARDKAGELSNAFVKLATDMGSMNNQSTEKVIEDVISALQGSAETLSKYGITATAAAVEQAAFRLGIIKTKDELDQATKAVALYSLMTTQAKDSINDMDRTSDSFANQLKALNGLIEDMTVQLGEALLPAATAVITGIAQWIKENETLIQQGLPDKIAEIAEQVEVVVNWINVLVGVFRILLNTAQLVFFGLVSIVNEFAAAIINGPIEAVNALITQINKIPFTNIPKIQLAFDDEKIRNFANKGMNSNGEDLLKSFDQMTGGIGKLSRGPEKRLNKKEGSKKEPNTVPLTEEQLKDMLTGRTVNTKPSKKKKVGISRVGRTSDDSKRAAEKAKREEEKTKKDIERKLEEEKRAAQQLEDFKNSLRIRELEALDKHYQAQRERLTYNYEKDKDEYIKNEDVKLQLKRVYNEEMKAVDKEEAEYIDAENKKKNEKQIQQLEDMQNFIKDMQSELANGLANSILDLAFGFDEAAKSFQEFAASFLREIAEMIIQAQILKAIQAASNSGGWVGKAFGFVASAAAAASANGNVFSNGRLVPFASGGVVNSPTVFPMANGMGLMGEAGPEAILPLSRGPNGKLGVASRGGNSLNNNVSINVNVDAKGRDKLQAAEEGRLIAQQLKAEMKKFLAYEMKPGGQLNRRPNY